MKNNGLLIKEVVEKVIGDLSSGEKGARGRAIDSWYKIVDEKIRKHTKPYALRNKKLFVMVDDSTWAFELSRRYKLNFVKRLKNELGENEVEDIYFRVGSIKR